MNEKEIMKGNLKLSVSDSFDFEELKKICEAIINLGYECGFLDDGIIVFQKKDKSPSAEKINGGGK
jgi:hypothetical protein